MSSKRGPGRFVAAHQTEAARRALIQPVPCWEYKWVIPPGQPSGSTLRVRQWIKTNKKQEFSDDEDDTNAALAPLPDEPADEEDEEVDEDAVKTEKENSVIPPSHSATPAPAETSGLGVPGLDTPRSGMATPIGELAPPALGGKKASFKASDKPHPLSASFGAEDVSMELQTPVTLDLGSMSGLMNMDESYMADISMNMTNTEGSK